MLELEELDDPSWRPGVRTPILDNEEASSIQERSIKFAEPDELPPSSADDLGHLGPPLALLAALLRPRPPKGVPCTHFTV